MGKNQLTQFGLENAHLESWGPFGRGWTLEACTANLVEPHYTPLIAYPKAWSPSTPKTIRGEPIYLDASNSEDLEKYRGKLSRAIVLISPPREVKAWFEPPATRKTDTDLLKLANSDPPSPRGGGPGFGGPGGRGGNRPNAAPAGATEAGQSPTGAPAATTQPPATTPAEGSPTPARAPDGRGALQLQTDKWQLAYDEGAAVVLEPGRGDGGTVFVASATMPRRPEPARSGPGRRWPR